MEYSEEMVISLSVASVQFVAAIVITYILAREYNRCTFLTILWLSYDLITHVTLEGPFVYFSLNGGIENSTHWGTYVCK